MTDESGGGVFIGKGWSIKIPSFSIHIDDEGNIASDPVYLDVLVELWPEWIAIADEALERAELARRTLEIATEVGAADDKRDALLAELRACMTVMAASAATWEGVHDAVMPRLRTRPDFGKGTAAKKKIAEVIRRACQIDEESYNKWREVLFQIFEFRNLAIHPSADYEATPYHAPLKAGAAVTFHRFRLENAQTVVSFTKKSLPSLLRNVRTSEPTVAEWAADKLHRVFGQEQPADAS